MADTLPSPPQSRSASPGVNEGEKSDKLSKQLDELLEQYLEFLDTYTKLREDLSKTLSGGFFSLAQAQRASTLGAGRRYGQECYDQRMKAQRTVRIEQTESNSTAFHVQRNLSKQKADVKRSIETVSPKNQIETVKSSGNENDEADSSLPVEVPKRVKQDPALRDPLTWFGILAPPTLRQTQSDFSRATEEIIPALLNVASDMKRLEDRIWTLRAELNLMSGYEPADADVGASSDAESIDEKVAQLSLAKDARSSGSKVQKSLQRPAHSKSILLKLGE